MQVTDKVFRYYKSRWTSNNALTKPLNAIPMSAINRLEVLEPEVKVSHVQASKSMKWRFEIVLKEDFLYLYFDPYYDIVWTDDKAKMKMTIDYKKKKLQ